MRKTSNRLRYRNRIRLPVVLFLVIVGGLVGTRWIKEVRAHHLQNRLSTELRTLNHDITELDRTIADLKGRQQSLLTEDALNAALTKRGVKMEKFDQSTVIEISAVPAGPESLAQNQPK